MKSSIIRRWIKKVLFAICVVFVVTTITFFLMHLVEGDPFVTSVEKMDPAMRQQYIEQNGLDKSIIFQYGIFLKNWLLNGELGVSLTNRTSTVSDILRSSMGISLLLGGISVFLGTVLGIAVGTVAAYTKRNYMKYLISFICVIGISLPVFVWAPILQNYIGLKLDLFPISGWGTAAHVVLPVFCMLPNTITTTMKYTKNSIEKIRNSNFYIAARQRGFSEWHVYTRHILKNALPPIITILVSSLSGIFTGAFIVEKIFAIPGVGRSFMSAISMRDYTIIIGLNIVFTVVYVSFRLIGDLFQELCNPLFNEER